MTSALRFPLATIVLLASMGCWSSTSSNKPAGNPLSMADWKKMPPETKYKVDTFERLKQGNPKLNEPEAWEAFVEEVIMPAKQEGR